MLPSPLRHAPRGTGRPVGSRAILGTAGALLLGWTISCQFGSWSVSSDAITGTLTLPAGSPATLRFRSTMQVDRDRHVWFVQLGPVAPDSDAAPDTAGHFAISVIGQVGGAAADCASEWVQPDTGTATPEWECAVYVTCPGGENACEAEVEFELLAGGSEPLPLEWVAVARLQGSNGCGSPEVDASVTLEQVD